MLCSFTIEFAYFYWYTIVRQLYINKFTKVIPIGAVQLSTAIELLLGALAGGLAQIFTIPVSVIATRQQLGGPDSNADESATVKSGVSINTDSAKSAAKSVANVANQKDSESFLGVARDIMKQDGITGFWRGLKPSLVLTVNPAITYGVYERECLR
jgi:adenine nucleotide transporter 17